MPRPTVGPTSKKESALWDRGRERRRACAAGLTAGLLLTAALSGADPRQLVVRVTEERAGSDGPVRPGAPVVLECAGETRQTTTDADGYAVLDVPGSVVLRPIDGACTLTVTVSGFCRWQERLEPDADVQVWHVEMRPMCWDITLPRPPSDRFSLTTRARFDAKTVALLPAGRSPWSLLETVEPAAVLDRIEGPGHYAGEPGRFSMRGSSWTQNTVTLDGLDVTDPMLGGTPLLDPRLHGLGAVEVTSALAPVEVGPPGVTLGLTSRPAPPHDLGGSVEGTWAPEEGGAGDASAPVAARLGSLLDAHAFVGGPLGARVHFAAGAEATRLRRFERDDPTVLRANARGVFGRIAYRGESDTWRAGGVLQRVQRPFAGRVRLADPSVQERDTFGGASAAWQRRMAAGVFSAAVAAHTGWFEPELAAETPVRPLDRVVTGPVPQSIFPAESRRRVLSAGATFERAPLRTLGLWHAARVGFSLSRSTSREHGGDTLPTPEWVDGLPARVWDYGYPATSRRRVDDVAAFLADRLTLRDRLFVEAGLRLDHSTGHADATATPYGVHWTALLPRLSARLRLTRLGRLSLFGGFGEYRHRLLLQHLAFGDPAGPQGDVFLWNDSNGDRQFQSVERGPRIARAGPGAADVGLSSIDPRLAPPRTREWVIGLTGRSSGSSLVVTLTAFDRRERDLLESVNVGASLSAYVLRTIPDPSGDIHGAQDDQALPVYDRLPGSFAADRYLLTNPPGLRSLHQAVELRIEARRGPWMLLAGGTASRSEIQGTSRGFRVGENDQGLVGEIFDDPNADTGAYGRGFFDRAYTIKIASTYEAPMGIQLGMVTRYQDGQPFARLVVVPGLSQGPAIVSATPRGQIERDWAKDAEGRYVVPSGHRFQYTLTLDGRIAKGLRLGARRLWLSIEGFNLLGLEHEVEEDPVWGDRFRTPTVLQPGRAFRFGAHLDF